MIFNWENNWFIGNTFTQNSNNVVDWNLYFAPAPGSATNTIWQWKKTKYTGFAAWKSGTGNDAHSSFADPLFINATNLNFHIATNSPAVNAGDPAFQSLTNMPNETDIDLQPRIAGGRTDIGADELNILSPTLGIAPLAPGQCVLQLTGEPGHPFVWQQSGTLPGGWVSFLTNSAGSGYWSSSQIFTITNPVSMAMEFFRAQMTQ